MNIILEDVDELERYNQAVLNYSEYIGTFDYISLLNKTQDDVSIPLSNTVFLMYNQGHSIRTTAITIFSLVMTEWIIPALQRLKKSEIN